jgi:UDP-glucose 6-dehydrogenase
MHNARVMAKAKKDKKTGSRKTKKPLIGFIGQGWIGKNYADDFERRGYETVRFALEEPYRENEDRIKEADIVFIAVPTPTTPEGFDDSIARVVLKHVGKGKTAVVKSTLKPGTTHSFQKQYPDIFVMHSPEFLSRGTAAQDAAHPLQNIVGIPEDTDEYRTRAQAVIDVLPEAPAIIVPAQTAEFFKYVHNTSLFARSIYMNLLYDIAQELGVNWDHIKEMIIRDPMIAFRDPVIAKWHIEPAHSSGRGIGGDCHIKDFETFSRLFEETVGDKEGMRLISAMKNKNIALLLDSQKDLNLLAGVYGDRILKGDVKSKKTPKKTRKVSRAKKSKSVRK